MHAMTVLAVVNVKGGVGKSTTAIHVGAGLAARGRTLLVDTDPQLSAYAWSQAVGDWPMTTIAMPSPDVHKRLPELARGFDHVVIDTPPGNEAIATGAVLAADLVLVPLPPATMDLNRLVPTLQLLARVEHISSPDIRILLTRTRSRTRSRDAAREWLGSNRLPVLEAEVPLREAYSLAFGSIVPAAGPDYEAVLDELLGEVPVA
jgi:chromosome partitioning protein